MRKPVRSPARSDAGRGQHLSSDGEGLRWCRTLKHAAAPTYDPHPKRTPPAATLPWSLKTRAGHAKVLNAGGGGRTRTELSLQRILSSIESWPPASKPRGIVGSAVRVCTLHPPLAKPVAVKLAVKISPEKENHAHRYHLRRPSARNRTRTTEKPDRKRTGFYVRGVRNHLIKSTQFLRLGLCLVRSVPRRYGGARQSVCDKARKTRYPGSRSLDSCRIARRGGADWGESICLTQF